MHPEDVRRTLENYQPSSIDSPYWFSVRSDVVALVNGLEPTSAADAKNSASTICRFLGWHKQPVDVSASLTEKSVGAFLFEFGRSGASTGYQRRLSTVLRQATRVAAGLPRVMPMLAHSRRSHAPVTAEELVSIAGNDPATWLESNPRHTDAGSVRLTLDIELLQSSGLVTAVRAGVGRRRLEAAVEYVEHLGNARTWMR